MLIMPRGICVLVSSCPSSPQDWEPSSCWPLHFWSTTYPRPGSTRNFGFNFIHGVGGEGYRRHKSSHQAMVASLAEWMEIVVDKPEDPRQCFKCRRDLGPHLEWKKMDTEAGPICYVCFNREASTAEATGRTIRRGGSNNA